MSAKFSELNKNSSSLTGPNMDNIFPLPLCVTKLCWSKNLDHLVAPEDQFENPVSE